MVECIRRSASQILGIFRGGGGIITGAWYWNKEVQERVKEKQHAYATLICGRSDKEKKFNAFRYKDGKKAAKKAITLVKNNAYERLY